MLPSIANVHDAYFKQILADAKVAGQFLRDHLPPEVVKLLAPQPPEPLRPYLPSFQHSLLDLAVTPDEKLSTVVRLRPPLLALKYARRADLPERLGLILAGVEELPLQDLKRMAVYLDKCPIRVSHERMRQELRRLKPEYEEKFMGWFSQGFFDDGVEQGRVEGEAKTLVRQLEKRFGPLPLEVRERVLAADLQSLDTWLDRVIDAADLKSVFEDALSA